MTFSINVTIYAESADDYEAALRALTSSRGTTPVPSEAVKPAGKPEGASGATAKGSDAPAPDPTSAPSPAPQSAPGLTVVEGRTRIRKVLGEDKDRARYGRVEALLHGEGFKSIEEMSAQQLLAFVQKVEKEVA